MSTSEVFALVGHEGKADPALIAADEDHLAAVGRRLTGTVAELTEQLAQARRAPAGDGQVALERDQQIHRLSGRLRMLERFEQDLCLGRMVLEGEDEPIYVGRVGLTDEDGRRLLVDWRSPAAEPFFGATHADPMGLVSRRRYRWNRGRISDYWDEMFTDEGLASGAALDDQSAFIASLGGARSERMRDVLGTIQADQHAIIRAGARGALVVDGGPGTGKTVVALHRAAYLLYSDPRIGHHRGGVLFVGPHQPYLSYVSDVLPSLGEEGVAICTLADLLPEGATARPEADPEVARLKDSAAMVAAIEPAIGLYEEPPTESMLIATEGPDVLVGPQDWAEAFNAVDPGTPHNEARAEILEALVQILVDRFEDEGADEGRTESDWIDEHAAADPEHPDEDYEDLLDVIGAQWTEEDPDGDAAARDLGETLRHSPDLLRAFDRAWPLIDPADLVGDLWTVPAYLRRCAPWLSPDEVRALQRSDAQAWTTSDLPLLDAARQRLGDPEDARRRQRQATERETEQRLMSDVVDHLIAHDDSDMQVMSMLRGQDLQDALVGASAAPVADPDQLAGPFLHIMVDEAQELTDAQWQMLLRRCPSRSLTIVGDRAQARHGFAETWQERLARIGLSTVEQASLSINYRTPAEVMAEAEPVIRAALPDANVPVSVRSTGQPVTRRPIGELGAVLTEWLTAHETGTACVIGTSASLAALPMNVPGGVATEDEPARVTLLTPELAKGLEFDLVVLVDPDAFGSGVAGTVDRYVAMTRTTGQLVILTG